jgi:hypothetical protein
MSSAYILIDLDPEQKAIILKMASFYLMDEATNEDLNNKRKKWIRFRSAAVSAVIGELSYRFNRSRSGYESMLLDELICHLEGYEKGT